VKAAGVFLNGQGIRGRDAKGGRVTDANALLYFNASENEVDFVLPSEEYGARWEIVVDTAAGASDEHVPAGSPLHVASRSVVVLMARP